MATVKSFKSDVLSASRKAVYVFVAFEAGHHRARQIDRQSGTTNGTEGKYRWHSTRSHTSPSQPHRSIILKNFKSPQNDWETGTIFSQPCTNLIQTRQKHRQFFGQKFISKYLVSTRTVKRSWLILAWAFRGNCNLLLSLLLVAETT